MFDEEKKVAAKVPVNAVKIDELTTTELDDSHSSTPDIAYQPAAVDIWDKKYRLKFTDGAIVDQTMDDTFKRAARALADVEESDSLYGWQHWEYNWEADHPGHYLLRARAVDEQGNIQPSQAQWNFRGYSVNSIHVVPVTVHNT